MLERVAAEEVEIGGQTMSMQEIELRSIQRKATKGDVAASRPLAKLCADAGVDKGGPPQLSRLPDRPSEEELGDRTAEAGRWHHDLDRTRTCGSTGRRRISADHPVGAGHLRTEFQPAWEWAADEQRQRRRP